MGIISPQSSLNAIQQVFVTDQGGRQGTYTQNPRRWVVLCDIFKRVQANKKTKPNKSPIFWDKTNKYSKSA